MTAKRSIGFVGLGNMGVPMVRCLAKAGHAVVAYDIRDGAAAKLASEADTGGRVTAAADLAAVGRAADIVVTMLPDSKVVRAAVLGADGRSGLAAALARGGIVVDMSSSYPLDTRRLAEDLAPRGISVVDAPVSGGVGKAVTGTLAIMVGGAAAEIARAEPMLSAMGKIHRTGPLGSGHAVKALNNYVSAAGLIATCEALVVAETFGLDAKTVIDTINASTGRNNTTENKALRYLVPRDFTSGFALALMAKDVGMARSLAADLGLDPAELGFVSAYLDKASISLGKTADHTAVMAVADGTKSPR